MNNISLYLYVFGAKLFLTFMYMLLRHFKARKEDVFSNFTPGLFPIF